MAKKKKAEESGLPQVARGALDRVFDALTPLRRTDYPLPVMKRIRTAKQSIIEAVQERDDLRKEIILQFDESGQGWENPEDAPPEALKKLQGLWLEPVSLDIGEPLVETEDCQIEGRAVDISEESYSILRELGLIVLANSENGGGG